MSHHQHRPFPPSRHGGARQGGLGAGGGPLALRGIAGRGGAHEVRVGRLRGVVVHVDELLRHFWELRMGRPEVKGARWGIKQKPSVTWCMWVKIPCAHCQLSPSGK